MGQPVDEIGAQQIAGQTDFLSLGYEPGGKVVLQSLRCRGVKGFEEDMHCFILQQMTADNKFM